jgi:glutaredoxin
MNEVKVLALDGCNHCKSLVSSLEAKNVPFEIVNEQENSSLYDRMEAILKINHYPMVIIEGTGSGAVYLYREDSYENAKPTPIGYATKVGCVSIDNMVDQVIKYSNK